MIDRINIRNGIDKIADQIFITEDISKDDINIFMNEVIKFVTNEFDAYVSEKEQDLIFLSEKKREAFNDFTYGYVSSIKL